MKIPLLVLTFCLTCCTSEVDRPETLGGGGQPPAVTSSCKTGDTKSCNIITEDRGSYIDCVLGVSTCTSGVWGPCEVPKRDGGADAAG